MPENINLSNRIEKRLPAELTNFLHSAGEAAQSRGTGLYLVGGVVRDLLLGRPNFDLDLVVEGDAIALAGELAETKEGKVTTHPRFGTAKIQWDKWSADLSAARTETYKKPGALPAVRRGSLRSDLFRRDFTVNAMAVQLAPSHYGEVIDIYGGMSDLEHRLVRVLHARSFIDDATRIWRALRYEQRLDFQIEADTLELLGHGLPMLGTVSGDRIRHELELVLKEEAPEKALRRAGELGVLARLHPSLKGDGWLANKFTQARQQSTPEPPAPALYLSLLIYRLSETELERLIYYLRYPRVVARAMRDTIGIKDELDILVNSDLKPSGIYCLLCGCSPVALTANAIAADSAVVGERIALFLGKLRYVKPALTGRDLTVMGVTSGPRISDILNRLRQARLDGEVSSRRDEEKLVAGCKPPG